MLSRRFDELLAELSQSYLSYRAIPRTPERVTDLAAARYYVDQIRRDIAVERERILSTTTDHYPTGTHRAGGTRPTIGVG